MKKTVAQIVSLDLRTAAIFKKHGIDFCCNGDKSLSEACNESKVNKKMILQEIRMLDEKKSETYFNTMDLDVLINHILDTHHNYVKESLPVILEFAIKVSEVHGIKNPETIEIAKLFNLLTIELKQHMLKEEEILFPHIRDLVMENKNLKQISFPSDSVKKPIKIMKKEHHRAGFFIKKIKELSTNFTPPSSTCNTHKSLYYHLKEFKDDLDIHIHLENNILFPKAIELEKRNKLLSLNQILKY